MEEPGETAPTHTLTQYTLPHRRLQRASLCTPFFLAVPLQGEKSAKCSSFSAR